MLACEKCKILFETSTIKCLKCGGKLREPEKTDDYLKKFLEIDDRTLNLFKNVREKTIKEAKNFGKKKTVLKAVGISGSARDEFDMAAEDSNSEFLLKEALGELESKKVETELIALRNYDIKHCKACYSTTNTQCHFYCSCYARGTDRADDMSNILYDKILSADILLFATPVNNFKMSSLMALFLDRCISLDGSLPPANPKAAKDKELNIKHTKFVQIMVDEKILGSGFFRRFTGKVGGIIVTGHEEGASLVISSLYMALNYFGMAFAPSGNMYAMSSIANPTYKDKPIVTGKEYCDEAKMVARNAWQLAKRLNEKEIEWQYGYGEN